MSNLHLTSLAADSGVTAGSGTKKLADFAPYGGQAVMHLNRNSTAAANPPLQMTDGAAGTDGTVVSWYTKPLKAVTIAGAITASLWTRENATNNNVAPTIRIERCSADGTVLGTIVSETTNLGAGEAATTASGASDVISITAANVTDTAIAAGERLRITLWIDDAADQGGTGSMASGGRGEMWVNGPVGAQGQAQIAFTEAVEPVAELLSAYNFDEASGNALDTTGNGRDFAVAGNMARTASGHTGSGLTTTATATEAGPSMFGQTGGRTLMAWVKVTADYTGWIFEWHDNTLDTGFWGLLRLSGSMGFRGRNAAGSIAFASVAQSADSAWHHWAGTYDGVNVRTYLDGTLVATTALANGIDTAQPDLIRMFTTAASVTVDDIRVYDGVLTQSEISTLKDTPVASAGTTGTLSATFTAQTGSLTGSGKASGDLAGTFSSQTASLSGTITAPTGTLSASFSAQTAALAAAAELAGTLAGSLSAQTASLSGTGSAGGTLSGSLSAQSASMAAALEAAASLSATFAPMQVDATVVATAEASVSGTFAAQTAEWDGSATANGSLAAGFSPLQASMAGTVQVDQATGSIAAVLSPMSASLSAELSASSDLSATFSAQLAEALGEATSVGSLSGTFAATIIALTGSTSGEPRDIAVVVAVAYSGPEFEKTPSDVGFSSAAPRVTAEKNVHHIVVGS